MLTRMLLTTQVLSVVLGIGIVMGWTRSSGTPPVMPIAVGLVVCVGMTAIAAWAGVTTTRLLHAVARILYACAIAGVLPVFLFSGVMKLGHKDVDNFLCLRLIFSRFK